MLQILFDDGALGNIIGVIARSASDEAI